MSTIIWPNNVSRGQPWTLQCVVDVTTTDIYNRVHIFRKTARTTFFEPVASSSIDGKTFISVVDLLFRANVTWDADRSTLTLSVRRYRTSDKGLYRCSLYVNGNPVAISEDKSYPCKFLLFMCLVIVVVLLFLLLFLCCCFLSVFISFDFINCITRHITTTTTTITTTTTTTTTTTITTTTTTYYYYYYYYD